MVIAGIVAGVVLGVIVALLILYLVSPNVSFVMLTRTLGDIFDIISAVPMFIGQSILNMRGG